MLGVVVGVPKEVTLCYAAVAWRPAEGTLPRPDLAVHFRQAAFHVPEEGYAVGELMLGEVAI